MSLRAGKPAAAAFLIAVCALVFLPRFAHSQTVQAYESSCVMNFADSLRARCSFTMVPEGKQLVIQEFDAQGRLDPGNRPFVLRLSTALGEGHYFTYSFMGNDDEFDYLDTHQATTLYVAGGRTPSCIAAIPKVRNLLSRYDCAISGYLVNATSDQQEITVQPQ